MGAVRSAPPGVQRERTGLAWNRTAAAMIVAGALHLRLGVAAGGGPAFVPGLLFIALGVLLLARSSRRRLGIGAGRPMASPTAYLVAGAVVLFGLVSAMFMAIAGD